MYQSLVTKNGTYYAADPGTLIVWDEHHQAYSMTVRGVRVFVPEPDVLFESALPPVQ